VASSPPSPPWPDHQHRVCRGQRRPVRADPARQNQHPNHPSPAPSTTKTPAVTYHQPSPDDFTLKVRTLKQENFGSAGSLVTYRVNASWTTPLDPAVTHEVTHEVYGAEDGTITNTTTVTGDSYEHAREETASTPSASTKLRARVVHVEAI
jgi:hypothetical protein